MFAGSFCSHEALIKEESVHANTYNDTIAPLLQLLGASSMSLVQMASSGRNLVNAQVFVD